MSHWNFKNLILEEIKKNGGWVNTHAHIDRSNTINQSNFHLYLDGEKILSQKGNGSPEVEKYLAYKWKINDNLKVQSSQQEYYDRMALTVEQMIDQGVSTLCTNIDVDYLTEDKVIQAAIEVREHYKDKITILYANQMHYGVLEKKARYWFDKAAEFVDIIGGLPEANKGNEAEHIEVLLKTGKKYNKMVHCHVDQFNTLKQKQTRLLAEKTIEIGMEGRVVGVHGISLAAQEKAYRLETYNIMKDANLMMIACPTAWLDSKRSEEMMPFHNACPPVDEFIEHGIITALGTDGISDLYVPICDGDMWTELRVLTHLCRLSNFEEIVKIATTNGRKVLGLV